MASALKGFLPRDLRAARRPRCRPLVELLETRDLPTVFTLNPLPGNLVGDINNQFLNVEFRKAPAGYFTGPNPNNTMNIADQLFSLDINDPNVIADATDPLPGVGIDYKDNGNPNPVVPAYPVNSARDIGQSSLNMVKQTGPPGGVNSGTFNDNAEDDQFAMQVTGYIFVNAGQAAASLTKPWTIGLNSDDEARVIMGANGQTVLGYFTCCGQATNTIIFNGAGYYPINVMYDQGGGGAYIGVWYNAGAAFGDGKNHALGDTLFNIDPTGKTKLAYYANVVTTVTPDAAGAIGANAGMNATFTKGASPVTTLAQANTLAGGSGVVALATDNGVQTLNYLDTALLPTYSGPLTLANIPAPRDVGAPPFNEISGTFIPGFEDDNFVMVANGFIQINPGQTGIWTFLVRSSNGEQLQIGPVGTTMQTVTITDGRRLIYANPPNSAPGFVSASVSGAYNDYGEVNFATAGLYHFTLTWFQSTGPGAMLQWLAKGPGQPNYALVGDGSADGNTLTVFQTELPRADVAVTVSAPTRAPQGSTVTYTITVTNNGPNSATNVVMNDAIPAGTTLVSFVQAGGPPFILSSGNGQVRASIASLAAGSASVFQLTVHLDVFPAGAMLTDTATVSSDQPPLPNGAVDTNLNNNTATLTTTVFLPPAPFYVTGSDAGTLPVINVFSTANNALIASFLAFGPTFGGGVRVAVGDLNGDGNYEIIAVPGPVSAPVVEIFSSTGQLLNSFFAITGIGGLPPGKQPSGTPSALGNQASNGIWTGGLFVATGDINAAGYQDIIVGCDAGGGPEVQVFDGQSLQAVATFFAFPPGFSGGVRVAAGDINGDGKADIICGAGPGGGPLVAVYDGASITSGANLIEAFFAMPIGFRGGVYVAAGDLYGNGQTEIVCGAGAGGGPLVAIFVGTQAVQLFYAYPPFFHGGVRVAVHDINGDGHADILTTPGKGSQPVTIGFDATSLAILAEFFAYNPLFAGGAFVG
jgi:uncharacterized repeat protein (TIGR01451 family)